MTNESILWRAIYWSGHEACRLFRVESEWRLEGTAVFSYEGRSCRLTYLIACDLSWTTLRAQVSGWVHNDEVNLALTANAHRQWQLNGVTKEAVEGCIDLDLNFSPSTNLLPIRRLNLEVGQQAAVKAAWLKFPSFELEPLPQLYTRVDHFKYKYSSGRAGLVSELTVNKSGFVTLYPGLWEVEGSGFVSAAIPLGS